MNEEARKQADLAAERLSYWVKNYSAQDSSAISCGYRLRSQTQSI